MPHLDIKLNTRFYEKIDSLKKRGKEYKSKIHRTKSSLEKAKNLSKKDIKEKIDSLSKDPSPKQAIALLRNLLNSGVWIGTSRLRHYLSLINLTYEGDLDYLTPEEMKVLKAINRKEEVIDYEDREIFQKIYNECEFSHYYPDHKPLLDIPKINCTIVLISGVFNEIFSTPAFERAAIHLQDTHGIKYFTPKVYGYKSSSFNSRIIERQLKSYTRKHPNEKLWLVCFSKGGLDTLKFLSHNSEFADKYIQGISTIASPILGSEHLDNKLLSIFNKLQSVTTEKLLKGELFAREFQNSLSSTFQRPWLRNNHDKLPDNIFYTALGFESKWYESHLWMIIMKGIIKSNFQNDGVVDAENSLYPYYFKKGINLGILRGHHLVGTRSSTFCQEALLESLIIFLSYKGLIS